MATHFKGKAREVKVLDAYIKLSRCTDSIRSMEDKTLSQFGLTSGQFGCLETLYHLGPMCQKEIGQKIFSCEGNITQIIDNLEKRNLVVRVRSEEDRRYFIINLTPAGKELIGKAFPTYVEQLKEKMSTLTDEDLTQLGHICKIVGLRNAN
ncbi:MarR family winged helix-turn-helix transcriptional regulator [Leptospira wolffii]|uniref:MarR family winged helix-turn-helix transcriptional regulator n=1 Tax=Leptospira wolffii TaxID=409998 RepID=A0ABV5BK42_9LEPT|nr:MarR family transcriptional regulator [Leptospira wolffii]EPG64385.1 MarR family protein [Leptospira wolffii serovar Khorat str. Khorat-H2]TGL49373.1 MarR family transcriptional regulator [Leptospira wolffii]